MAVGTDDSNLLNLAAGGSRAAQSGLVDLAVYGTPDAPIRPIESLVAAELFARLAASHGETNDIRRLASVLMIRAGYERQHGFSEIAAALDAEALTLLDIGADAGDELAGRLLVEAADLLPAAPFEMLAAVKAGAK